VDELYEDQAAQAFILQFLDGGEPGHSRRIALGLTLGFVLGARFAMPSCMALKPGFAHVLRAWFPPLPPILRVRQLVGACVYT
jgi:hypothetical protein